LNIQDYIQSGAIESYVLGLADDEDAAELRRLKDIHPEVAAAVDAAEKWLHDYAQAHAVPAAEEVREKFLDMLKTKAVPPVSPTSVHRMRRHNGYRYLAAASIALLLVSGTYIYFLHLNYKRALDNYALVSNPSVIKIPLLAVPGKENSRATLYWDTNNKNVYLDAGLLPKAPTGMQYQLWALVDGKPIDAGVVVDSQGLSQLKTIQKAQAFAITLEKAGGSLTPTLSQMYVMGNVKS
jgi:anti-sigma-K factor RskA